MIRHGCKTTQVNSSGRVTCAVCSIQHRPNVYNAQQEDQGVKELLEARQTSPTKAKNATATKKGSMATNGKPMQPTLGSQPKGKEKQQLTNGNNKMLPMIGTVTKGQKTEATALVGKMLPVKGNTKVSKLSRSME